MTRKLFCENCGKELKGRSDKRFCDDSCRNTFNHKARIPDNEVFSPVVNILKKNRAILFKAFDEPQKTFTKLQLLELGYNFNYCTDRRTIQGSEYYFCFDMCFEISNDYYVIISATYFEFINRDYLLQLPDMPTGDPAIADDVSYWEMMRGLLHINSELKEPPQTKRLTDSNLHVIE